MKILVTENFRHANGQIAADVPIDIFIRDTVVYAALFSDPSGTVPLENPLTTDEVGNLNFYVEEGSYDYIVFNVVVPFDVISEGEGAGPIVHNQNTALAEWIFNHNLGRNPDITVIINNFTVSSLEIAHVSLNQARIRFVTPQTGKALAR